MFGYKIITEDEYNEFLRLKEMYVNGPIGFEQTIEHLIEIGKYIVKESCYMREGHKVIEIGENIMKDIVSSYL